jgi:hypothetical protein
VIFAQADEVIPAGGSLACWSPSKSSTPVLLVTHLFHPLDDLAVELFLDGDVGHGGGRRGPVIVLHSRRDPHHIARPDFLDRPVLALDPAVTGGDDQGLTERMGVPCRASARLESDSAAASPGRLGRAEQRIDTNRTADPQILWWRTASRFV